MTIHPHTSGKETWVFKRLGILLLLFPKEKKKKKRKNSEVLSFTKFLLTSKDLFLVMIPVLLGCGI